MPSDLDSSFERLQFPLYLFLPELFVRRIAIYDGYHLRVRRYAQKAFEKNEKAMGDRNDRIGAGEHGIINPPCFQRREKDRHGRKHLLPVTLDEVGRRGAHGNDQIWSFA